MVTQDNRKAKDTQEENDINLDTLKEDEIEVLGHKNPTNNIVQVVENPNDSEEDLDFADPELVKETDKIKLETVIRNAKKPSPSQATKFLSEAWANMADHYEEEDLQTDPKEPPFELVSHRKKNKKPMNNKSSKSRVGISSTFP